ncbi:hypothetical protein [Burkholderia contaminans]|uniref:hypothetical protein n=2 Tax=Burkholderia TaxID=32008 RepID=UPI0020C5DF12|nr:hypothetical protein [Burkholderia contaminans]
MRKLRKSPKTSASLSSRNAGKNMGITQEELSRRVILIDETYEVEVYVGPSKTWQVDLVLKSGKRVEVETQRGTPKMWRTLDKALDFAIAYCTQRSKLTVRYQDLKLESPELD